MSQPVPVRPHNPETCGQCKCRFPIHPVVDLCALHAKAEAMRDLLNRIFIASGDKHFDTCDFVKFDTARYACNCGNNEARALLAAIDGRA